MSPKTDTAVLDEVEDFLANNFPADDEPVAGSDAVDMLAHLCELVGQRTPSPAKPFQDPEDCGRGVNPVSVARFRRNRLLTIHAWFKHAWQEMTETPQ